MLCVYPKCKNTPRTRGLCHPHYQTARAYIRAGKATEADLSERGLMLPNGQGGCSVDSHEALLLGASGCQDEADFLSSAVCHDLNRDDYDILQLLN